MTVVVFISPVTINAHEKPKPKCIYYSQKLLTSARQQVSRNFPETQGSQCFWKSIKTVYRGKVWAHQVILWCALLLPIDNWTNRENMKSSGWDISSEATVQWTFKTGNVSSSQMSVWSVGWTQASSLKTSSWALSNCDEHCQYFFILKPTGPVFKTVEKHTGRCRKI